MSAPTRIGRYEIVRRLGKGMTEVYLAIDTVANRQAALKLVNTNGDSVSRLIIEAERRGAAILKELHGVDPRVVEIYDYGDADGYFFVAMEFVEGRNLCEVLQSEQAIDPIRAASIALEICEQLAKFHTRQSGVVHGDIKPSNIHLGWNNTVRLLDFGIAKSLRANGDATDHNFGSPGYCSPERLARSEVDQQSDLWAVGATLYEMLAGVPPYQAENTRKLENLIRSKRPPRALSPSCPRGLSAIVSKALAPNPGQRYRTAAAFQADLQAFLERRVPVAEIERRAAWSANATLEAARSALRKATRTVGQWHRRLRLASAVGWFAAGMVLWIGGTYLWQAMEARSIAATPPATPPATLPNEGLPLLYVAAADRILDSYATSQDPSLHDFDWQKAEVCLTRAVELGGGEDRTLGKLALSRGYATLQRLDGGDYAEPAASQQRLYVRGQFESAAQKLPRDPAPHLALARVYVYQLTDIDRAIEEFAAAERLGATLGRRELEQQGDGYRIRSKQFDRPAALVAQDAAAARALYARIPGFDMADEHLQELTPVVHKLVVPARRKPVKNNSSSRRRRWR